MADQGSSDPVQVKRPWEPGYGDTDQPRNGLGGAVAQIRKPRFVHVNIPTAYEQHCHRTYGRSDPDFVREQYDKDYPIVNPNGDTEFARRGMPDGHDAHGNAMYQAGVPPGVKFEMMRLSLLNTQDHSYTPIGWQATGLDTCAAKREASGGNSLYNAAQATPSRSKSSYTYSYTPGHEPWKVQHGNDDTRAAEDAKEEEDDEDEDSNLRGITGGLGLSARNSQGTRDGQSAPNSQDRAVDVSTPPAQSSNPSTYVYTRGDEWQQASDPCAAKRRLGGGRCSDV